MLKKIVCNLCTIYIEFWRKVQLQSICDGSPSGHLLYVLVSMYMLTKLGCWQITYTLTEPEIAFTGDTMSDFICDENNTDVLRARILVVEVNYSIQYL